MAVLPPGRIQAAAAGGIRRACLGKRRVLLHHKLSLPRRIKHMWDHPTGMPEPEPKNEKSTLIQMVSSRVYNVIYKKPVNLDPDG